MVTQAEIKAKQLEMLQAQRTWELKKSELLQLQITKTLEEEQVGE